MKIDSVGIIGGGAWGTALAETLARAGREVVLWAREAETIEDINTRHVNRAFLPGVSLAPSLRATDKLKDVAAADAVLMVAPAQHVRRVASELSATFPEDRPLVVCAKGIEQATGKLMGDVIAEALPQATLAVLSGPSFAADVARGLPAALTLACRRAGAGRDARRTPRRPQLPSLLDATTSPASNSAGH